MDTDFEKRLGMRGGSPYGYQSPQKKQMITSPLTSVSLLCLGKVTKLLCFIASCKIGFRSSFAKY